MKEHDSGTGPESCFKRYAPLLAALFYGFTSISITFFNKSVLSEWRFEYSNVLLLLQCIFTAIVVITLRKADLIAFEYLPWHKVQSIIPLAVFYCGNVGLALASLKFLNVPMYGTLKRLTLLFILFGEITILKKKLSNNVILSVLIITVGAVVAGLADISFDLIGYILALSSCFFQAAYLIYASKNNERDAFDLLFYNSVLSIPFLVLISLYTGELQAAFVFPYWNAPAFLGVLSMSLILGALLNYATFLSSMLNSALTTSVVGHIKAFLSTFVSFFTFGGLTTNPTNFTGMMISTVGGVAYGYFKEAEKVRVKPAAQKPLPT